MFFSQKTEKLEKKPDSARGKEKVDESEYK